MNARPILFAAVFATMVWTAVRAEPPELDPTAPASPPADATTLATDPPAGAEPTADDVFPDDDFALPPAPATGRNFAGSVQLDYMMVPTSDIGRRLALDSATSEVSLKMTVDYHARLSASVKVCIGCHGLEVGMAFFDVRVADELNLRVGRFTPALGEFPLRHDPADHRTSDKPLVYDMGRMLRGDEWNGGVLPTPWVDNGVELNGSRFLGRHLQVDYALCAVGGPRAGYEPVDFNFKLSRTGEAYYVDNNSRPVCGAHGVLTLVDGARSLALGASMMRGTYDPDHRPPFAIYGAHAVARHGDLFLRAEYLFRRTTMAIGMEPATRFTYGAGMDGTFDPVALKDGGHVELEAPVGKRLTLVGREDAMRRRGNVLVDSPLRDESAVLRHTAAAAFLAHSALRLKLSYERMRRQPSSGISEGDATIILRCLGHLQQLRRDQRDRQLDGQRAGPLPGGQGAEGSSSIGGRRPAASLYPLRARSLSGSSCSAFLNAASAAVALPLLR